MKSLLSILWASSLLYGAPQDGIDDGDNSQMPEIAAFDPLIVQQPISSDAIQFPDPFIEPRRKSPFLAVGLSALFPGLGHAYLGDLKTAGGLGGTAGLGIGLVSSSSNEAVVTNSLVSLQTTWSYGIYAAYRDVRLFNGNAGYSYKMPNDSFADLSFAPFRWRVLKKPEVWGGFLGALALVAGTGYAIQKTAHIQPRLSSGFDKLSPLIAFPIGLGEESLFRGFLQSQLAETFTPWGGIVLSSLAFGAMHIPNALLLEPEDRMGYYTFSLPLITTLGAYFGWVTYKNHSLQESVALHSWYDFAIFAAGALASQTAAAGYSGDFRFALAIPF